ncbi:MAG: superoxide dismutase, partial [Actinomycetota bacterium]|nr:superoxide dismutase [Actinomycetota bacterium]
IEATPNGKTLVVVQSVTGRLFTVDARTGATEEIALGGETVDFGDGILLQGRTLYVVQNFLNRIAVVRLAPKLARGAVVRTIDDPAFDVPTTIDRLGRRLYAVNARFSTPPTPSTPYEIVRVRR